MEIILLPVSGKKVELDSESTLILYECDELGRNHPTPKITLPSNEDLYSPRYEGKIQETLAVWRQCRWEKVEVFDQVISRNRRDGLVVETISDGTRWVLREGNPLPWMYPHMDEAWIRGEVIRQAAKADGSLTAALVAAEEQWLAKALAEGGQCPPPVQKPLPSTRPAAPTSPVKLPPAPIKKSAPASRAPKKVLPPLDETRYVEAARAAGYTVIQKGEWKTWHVQGSFVLKGFGRKGHPIQDPPLVDFCKDRGIK